MLLTLVIETSDNFIIHYVMNALLQRQCSHVKEAIGQAADISNKADNRIAFLFFFPP